MSTPGDLLGALGREARARFGNGSPAGSEITLSATLGRVPSTAGNPREAVLRSQSFQVLHGLPRLMPRPWRVSLLPDHRVHLSSRSRQRSITGISPKRS